MESWPVRGHGHGLPTGNDWVEQVLDGLPEGVAVVDRDGVLLWVNPAFARLAGRPPELLAGRSALELVDEASRTRMAVELDHRAEGRPGTYSVSFQRPDGVRVVARVSANPWWTGGVVGGSVAVVTDLTEERAFNERLRASEERFRQVTSRIEEVFWLINRDANQLVYVNEAYERVWGRSRSELEADMATGMEAIHPEDRPTLSALFDSVRAGEEVRDVEYRVRRPDGEVRSVMTSAFPVHDDDGAVYRIAGVTRDVTALRRSEALRRRIESRYRTVIEQAGDGVAVHSTDGILREVNDQLCAWTGLGRADLVGHSIEVLFADPPDPALAALHEDVAASEVVRTYDATLATIQGPLAVDIRCTAIEEPGSPAILVSLIRDVSQRKAREIEARLVQKLESMGRLAAGIAHEINTPIQYVGDSIHFLGDGIRAMTELLAREAELFDDPDLREDPEALRLRLRALRRHADLDYFLKHLPGALQRSLEGVDRVTGIVQAMRRLAHHDGGEPTPTDLDGTIRTALTVSRNEYKYHADVELDLGLDREIVCDPGDIGQVVLNVVLNAADAIRERFADGAERGRITIRSRESGGWAVVQIADTGSGIPDAIRDRVFEPFFTTKPVGSGTGQGLALARSVMERHGGAIEFRSEAGVGTTFELRLPIEAAAPGAVRPQATPPPFPGSLT